MRLPAPSSFLSWRRAGLAEMQSLNWLPTRKEQSGAAREGHTQPRPLDQRFTPGSSSIVTIIGRRCVSVRSLCDLPCDMPVAFASGNPSTAPSWCRLL
jgi:hypothetical protein